MRHLDSQTVGTNNCKKGRWEEPKVTFTYIKSIGKPNVLDPANKA